MDISSLKQQLISAYDRHAAERDASPKQSWKISERESFLQMIDAHNARNLLEIGSGPGHDAQFFRNHGLDTTCVDLSPQMIHFCRQKGLNAHIMDFSHLTFPDNTFDAVWALNCLLHVPKAELDNVLREIQRVLKPDGLFYMGVYGRHNSEGIWGNDHYEPKRFFSFFDKDTLDHVLSDFFTIHSFRIFPHSDAMDFQSIVLMNHKGDSTC